MKHLHLFLCALSLLAAPSLIATDVQACGGCLHAITQSETTQVIGHRMILSLSKDRTTLWDQIKYSGNPQSFAWVLPIKGTVEVGLSSDALFNSLEDASRVVIQSPSIDCPPPNCSGGLGAGSSASSSAMIIWGMARARVLRPVAP